MKKLLSLFALCLVLGIANAQNQRIVVLECFTSATCGPCASYNPQLDNLINNNTDKLIAIKYHVNWPVNYDPMNHHNPTEVASRVSYYGVNSVPMSVGDGTWIGNSANVTQSMVDQWAAVSSPVEMRMTHYLNDTQDSIFVVVMGKALSAIESDGLKLHISVLEKTMEYPTAPGTNGERIFHNVMKKMLPNASGTTIDALETGEYFAYKYSWALANVMDINELTAVAWLQDNNSKVVVQGCMSSDDFQPFYEKQANISKLDHAKKTICSSTVNPDIYITNFGSKTINSLVVNFSINGTSISDLSWQGNITSGKTAKINLGELNFDNVEILTSNEMIFEITQINGASDDYAQGRYTYNFSEASTIIDKPFKLTIRTDDEPQLITWDVKKALSGEVVANGGPYEEVNKQYTENFELEDDDCYIFTIYDAGDNGLQGGNGFYAIKVGGQTIISGSAFTDMESNEFSFSKYSGVDENDETVSNIYPNPSNGIITIDIDVNSTVTIYNITGQMVYNQSIDGKTSIDLSNFEKGTYLVVLKNDRDEISKQVIVLK